MLLAGQLIVTLTARGCRHARRRARPLHRRPGVETIREGEGGRTLGVLGCAREEERGGDEAERDRGVPFAHSERPAVTPAGAMAATMLGQAGHRVLVVELNDGTGLTARAGC